MISMTDARYNAATHTVWISRIIITMMDCLLRKSKKPYLWGLLKNIPQEYVVMCVRNEGNQWCLYQQVMPLPNTHRFVRLLLMDAQSRYTLCPPDASKGFHQEAEGVRGMHRVWAQGVCTYSSTVSTLIARISMRNAIGLSSVRQGWN